MRSCQAFEEEFFQGIFFRFFTSDHSTMIKLTGFWFLVSITCNLSESEWDWRWQSSSASLPFKSLATKLTFVQRAIIANNSMTIIQMTNLVVEREVFRIDFARALKDCWRHPLARSVGVYCYLGFILLCSSTKFVVIVSTVSEPHTVIS